MQHYIHNVLSVCPFGRPEKPKNPGGDGVAAA